MSFSSHTTVRYTTKSPECSAASTSPTNWPCENRATCTSRQRSVMQIRSHQRTHNAQHHTRTERKLHTSKKKHKNTAPTRASRSRSARRCRTRSHARHGPHLPKARVRQPLLQRARVQLRRHNVSRQRHRRARSVVRPHKRGGVALKRGALRSGSREPRAARARAHTHTHTHTRTHTHTHTHTSDARVAVAHARGPLSRRRAVQDARANGHVNDAVKRRRVAAHQKIDTHAGRAAHRGLARNKLGRSDRTTLRGAAASRAAQCRWRRRAAHV
jgi:hypothetical protein